MTCVFCGKAGIAHSGCAICMVCGASICTDNCASPNGYFHGGRCKCGCHHYICEAHVLQHSKQDHGQSDGSSCFPALAQLARDAVDVCTKLFLFNAGMGEADPRPEGSEKLSLFLNVLTPGWRALGQAIERLPSDHYETRAWPEPVAGQYVSLEPTFFSEAMIDRVFVLAMHSLGRAAANDPAGRQMRLPHITSRQRDSMEGLATWATGKSKQLSDDVLRAWIRGDETLTPTQEDIVFRYMDRAASVAVPTDSAEVVDFLIPALVAEYA